MRYSPEHKAKNHERILSVAARSFRERGGDTSGIGTVMKKVGLKKGGFYRHFKSKDDLFVEAVARALDETGACHYGNPALAKEQLKRVHVKGGDSNKETLIMQQQFPAMPETQSQSGVVAGMPA